MLGVLCITTGSFMSHPLTHASSEYAYFNGTSVAIYTWTYAIDQLRNHSYMPMLDLQKFASQFWPSPYDWAIYIYKTLRIVLAMTLSCWSWLHVAVSSVCTGSRTSCNCRYSYTNVQGSFIYIVTDLLLVQCIHYTLQLTVVYLVTHNVDLWRATLTQLRVQRCSTAVTNI